MSWIVEYSDVGTHTFGDELRRTFSVGNGFLINSLEELPNDFRGHIWNNTVFTIPHNEDIGAAGEVGDEPNWGLADLGVEQFWGVNARGKSVRVGIADTGIDCSHSCLSHIKLDASNYCAFRLDDGQGFFETPHDSGWHGTHCAGTIFGWSNNGVLRGFAPDADISFARVLDNWNGSVSSIKGGLGWLCNQNCDIVSLSLGWPGLHDEWASEIKSLIDSGVIVVAASGNEFGLNGSSPSRSPGNYPFPELITVGAYDLARAVWARSGGDRPNWPDNSLFSGFNGKVIPTIVGPGVGIISSIPNNSYKSSDGTSMAAPEVAGLLACGLSLLKSKNVDSARKKVIQALYSSVRDCGDQGVDNRYGMGEIDRLQFFLAIMALVNQ